MLPWPPVRAQPETIPAPPFPREMAWVNVAPLRMDKQRGRPVLIEFWDFCRVNSLRTLPYMKAWHERYAGDGLRVIGVHAGGFLPARDEGNVRRAVERLGVTYPVAIDARLELWDMYGNIGWHARYLWDQSGWLVSMHYGEGAYDETEREIQELLGIERELVEPIRPEDAPGVLLEPQTADIALPADRERLELVRDWTDGEDWIAAADAGAAAGFSYSAGGAYAALSEGGVESGLYEVDGTVEAESPGLRLHGLQFTPVPPARCADAT
jgi:thiol-disulfide isomerase/thioredoxin